MKKYLLSCWAVAALSVLAGCRTPIGADLTSPRSAYLNLQQNALNSRQYSADTVKVLHRYDLEKSFKKNPDATLEKLQTIACNDDRRDLIYALSELNYWNGDRQSRSVKPGVPRLARNSYFASAIYAYLYLFGEGREAQPNPFDIRFRAAGDFYNRGLAQGLMVNTNALVELDSGPRRTPPGVVEVQFTGRRDSRPRCRPSRA